MEKDTYANCIHVHGTDIVHNATVYGLPESIRRAKFPMAVDTESTNKEITPGILKLAQSAKGEGHDQFLTGIIVQFDLTFSNKAWVEMERYHFIDFVSSQSTMHRITKFDLDKSYNEYVDPRMIEVMKDLIISYNAIADPSDRDLSEEERTFCEKEKRRAYLEIPYSNPAGFCLTAGMTTNYRQLKTIYAQRKNHRLPEWRAFCAWIETLPMSELITGCSGN